MGERDKEEKAIVSLGKSEKIHLKKKKKNKLESSKDVSPGKLS